MHFSSERVSASHDLSPRGSLQIFTPDGESDISFSPNTRIITLRERRRCNFWQATARAVARVFWMRFLATSP